jgi:hypothetical protein
LTEDIRERERVRERERGGDDFPQVVTLVEKGGPIYQLNVAGFSRGRVGWGFQKGFIRRFNGGMSWGLMGF